MKVTAARLLLGFALLHASASWGEFTPRKHVHVVGSSTAFPIIASAAEHFGRNSKVLTPVVESTGTGGGIKLFCSGLGLNTPDVVMASRSMKPSERRICENHHVTDIREIKIGFDGIVIAGKREAPSFSLQQRDIYLALAREVPAQNGAGKLIPNPYNSWQEINPDLPDIPIRVYGPPPTSGTRDILLERLLTNACLQYPRLQQLQQATPAEFRQSCHTLREDGAFINAGENDARLVRKLIDDPNALGIMGFNFVDRNRHLLHAALIDGVKPGFETIDSGLYPLSRPLYLYTKPRHEQIVGGLRKFIDDLTHPDSIGPEGRLVDQGLIPLPGTP